MDALPLEECWHVAHRLATKFRLGSGWSIQCDLIRSEHPEYCPEAEWPDPVSYLIEQERRGRFRLTGEAATRLSRYFLALSYEPALHGGRRAARLLFSTDEDGREGPGEKALAVFEKRLGEIDALLRTNLPAVRRLQSYKTGVGARRAGLLRVSAVCTTVHYGRRSSLCRTRDSRLPQSIPRD